jgi:hypothetical protein
MFREITAVFSESYETHTLCGQNPELLIVKVGGTYCYMCEVSLVVALVLLQQCNSTTLAFP